VRPVALLRIVLSYRLALFALAAIACWTTLVHFPIIHGMAWSSQSHTAVKIAADGIGLFGVAASIGLLMRWWLRRAELADLSHMARAPNIKHALLSSSILAAVTLIVGMAIPLLLSFDSR
jgi:hypothetical protein